MLLKLISGLKDLHENVIKTNKRMTNCMELSPSSEADS
jgi:hypothetical protein